MHYQRSSVYRNPNKSFYLFPLPMASLRGSSSECSNQWYLSRKNSHLHFFERRRVYSKSWLPTSRVNGLYSDITRINPNFNPGTWFRGEKPYHQQQSMNFEDSNHIRGGFRGGGADAPPQGFDPLPTQRVPPLILFQKSLFGRPTLKFF